MVKLSNKQKNLLDKCCKARFGLDFDTVYKMVESNENKKKADKEERKRLHNLKSEATIVKTEEIVGKKGWKARVKAKLQKGN